MMSCWASGNKLAKIQTKKPAFNAGRTAAVAFVALCPVRSGLATTMALSYVHSQVNAQSDDDATVTRWISPRTAVIRAAEN